MVQQPRHAYMRALVAPAFSQAAVEALTPRMVSVISGYLESWADSAGPVLAEPQLKAMTFDFICAVSAWCEYCAYCPATRQWGLMCSLSHKCSHF